MFNWFKKEEKGIIETIEDLQEQNPHWMDELEWEETCHNKISNTDVVECEGCNALVRKGKQETRQNLKANCSWSANVFWGLSNGDIVKESGNYELETLHYCKKCAPRDSLLYNGEPVSEIRTGEKKKMKNVYSCNKCDFTTESDRGLAVHKGVKHK